MMRFMELFALPTEELRIYLKQQAQVNPFLEEMDDIHEEILDKENNKEENTEEVEIDSDKAKENEIDWEEYFSENDYQYKTQQQVQSKDDERTYELTLSASVSLLDHLTSQLYTQKLTPTEVFLGELIIGNIDDDGFFPYSPHDVLIMAETNLKQSDTTEIDSSELTIEKATKVLEIIQEFDPVGIATRSVRESLLIQLEYFHRKETLEYRIIDEYFDEFKNKKYRFIAKELGVSEEEIYESERIIKLLDPKPGSNFYEDENTEVTPDVIVEFIDGKLTVFINDSGIPRMKINSFYRKLLSRKDKNIEEGKEYLKQKLNSAAWLIKAVEQRKATMFRISEKIVEFQEDFFYKGPQFLKPMILKDIAEILEIHPTTVGRIVNSKYMQTPYGVYNMKFFFTSKLKSGDGGDDVSSRELKEKIKELVNQENKSKPLSDSTLEDELKKMGYAIARRTVTKYREQMGILSSRLRKKK